MLAVLLVSCRLLVSIGFRAFMPIVAVALPLVIATTNTSPIRAQSQSPAVAQPHGWDEREAEGLGKEEARRAARRELARHER